MIESRAMIRFAHETVFFCSFILIVGLCIYLDPPSGLLVAAADYAGVKAWPPSIFRIAPVV